MNTDGAPLFMMLGLFFLKKKTILGWTSDGCDACD